LIVKIQKAKKEINMPSRTYTLLIQKLPKTIPEKEIRRKFSKYGYVKHIIFSRDSNSNHSSCYISFEYERDALLTKTKFDGCNIFEDYCDYAMMIDYLGDISKDEILRRAHGERRRDLSRENKSYKTRSFKESSNYYPRKKPWENKNNNRSVQKNTNRGRDYHEDLYSKTSYLMRKTEYTESPRNNEISDKSSPILKSKPSLAKTHDMHLPTYQYPPPMTNFENPPRYWNGWILPPGWTNPYIIPKEVREAKLHQERARSTSKGYSSMSPDNRRYTMPMSNKISMPLKSRDTPPRSATKLKKSNNDDYNLTWTSDEDDRTSILSSRGSSETEISYDPDLSRKRKKTRVRSTASSVTLPPPPPLKKLKIKQESVAKKAISNIQPVLPTTNTATVQSTAYQYYLSKLTFTTLQSAISAINGGHNSQK